LKRFSICARSSPSDAITWKLAPQIVFFSGVAKQIEKNAFFFE